MQLEQGKALDEGIDRLNSNLLPLEEYNLHALKERCKVLGLGVGRPRLLKQPLNDCVQGVDEILLVHLERGGACVKDLKCAEQTCQYVANVLNRPSLVLVCIELDFEVLAHN